MIRYRKTTDRNFSVHRVSQTLRKLSPTLVSLVVQKKRKLTMDRVDDFAKLLELNATERNYLRNWIGQLEGKNFIEAEPREARKEVGEGILRDWINLYVKDFFEMPNVTMTSDIIEKQLMTVASRPRISKAIQFLLREGYLRKTLDGKIVPETRLSVTDPKVPSHRIRQFHKGALSLAKIAIDLFPPTERFANTATVALSDEGYKELVDLIEDFSEKLKDFVARNEKPGNRLYQILVNLSPVGGKIE
jgi:uncharacterized protein (TIGR02147 family)